MKYLGIIFDLDGVICFTDEYHYLAWKKLADKEHIYFDREINNRLRGVSRMESLEIILERSTKTYTFEEKTAMAEYKNSLYKEYLKKMTPLDLPQETLNTIKEIKKLGIKIGIGSSSKNTKLILKQLNITNLFDAISDGTNITKSKPDPEVFLKAAEMLHLNPNECVIMEDVVSGIDAGINGGFDTIAVGDAVNYNKSNYKVKEFKEILNILK